jgi:hypothetical protein
MSINGSAHCEAVDLPRCKPFAGLDWLSKVTRLVHLNRALDMDNSLTTAAFKKIRLAALLSVSLIAMALGGCASGPKRPVFYPNAHLQSVGRAQGERDIDVCMAQARDYGVNQNKDGEIGKRAAKGGILGGVGAGVWGLVRGEAGERAVAGAAAGAATGATVGAFESTELNPTFKRFVQRCLAERGYDVIGWE